MKRVTRILLAALALALGLLFLAPGAFIHFGVYIFSAYYAVGVSYDLVRIMWVLGVLGGGLVAIGIGLLIGLRRVGA